MIVDARWLHPILMALLDDFVLQGWLACDVHSSGSVVDDSEHEVMQWIW